MSLLLRFVPVILALSGVSSASAQPAADDRARARVAFERGVVEMEAGRWQPALDAFQESITIRSTQVAILNAGNCLENLHRVREAIQMYERFLADFGREATAQRRAHAEEKIRTLRATMGTLTITVDTPGAVLTVDGESVGTAPLAEPLVLSAGPHMVVARVEGRPDATSTATVRAGETTQLALVVPQAAPAAPPVDDVAPPVGDQAPAVPPPSPERRSGLAPGLFWVAAGLTAAGAIGTGILGALVVSKDAEYRDSVPRTAADQSSGEDLVLVTDIVLGVTVVAAVGALILFTQTDFGGSEDEEAPRARLELDLGPRTAGLRLTGTF